MPHSPNKENVSSYASQMNKTPPPPSLVPMEKVTEKKMSLTGTRNKRVRFSLAEQEKVSGPAFSPIRLNADIVPAGAELPAFRGRKSSVATISPGNKSLNFPSEEDLLRGDTIAREQSPPASSPESVASRQSSASSTGGLGFVTSSFSGLFKPSTRSLWDTPSRASPASTVSPRKSTTTPGGAERRLFQFKVGSGEEEARQFDFSSVLSAQESGIAVPIPSPRPGDDPMLLSGGTSVVPMSASSFGTDMITPGSTVQRSHRRRRRRLSSLQDIESELYESGASPIRHAPNIGAMSPKLGQECLQPENFKEFIDMCLGELVRMGVDQVGLNAANLEEVAREISQRLDIPPSGSDDLRTSQYHSLCLSVENGAKKLLDRIEDNRNEARKLVENAKKMDPDTVVLFKECMQEFSGKWSQFCSDRLHVLVNQAREKSETDLASFALAVAENQITNIAEQSAKYVEEESGRLNCQMDEVVQIERDCSSLSSVLVDLKSQSEAEFNTKFHVNENGEVERIKSESELELIELDSVYREKESEILRIVEDITRIEEECDRRESVYRANFLKLNQFFSRNGWNVMKETSMFVYVYCCCHMFVFQRAKNNATCLRFEDVIPVKLDTNPVYAESHLVDVPDFQVPDRAIYDVVPIVPQETSFLYEPQTFYNLMNVLTIEIAQWTKLRERLYSVRRKINSLPGTVKSLVKVNINYQIEIFLAVKNSSGDSLPVAARMMWFDPIIRNSVNYANFSYIVTDLVTQYFPSLKEQIDARVRESCTVWESSSFELLESIVLGIHSAALKSAQVVATLPRE